MESIEVADWTKPAVILKPHSRFLENVVAYLQAGSEFHAGVFRRSSKRFLQGWIKGEVPAAKFLVDDGAYFPGPCVRGKRGTYISKFRRETNAHWQMPSFRNPDPRTDV